MKSKRLRYTLDTGDVKNLAEEEIKAILRAADEIIATGGRTMLAKILKGSRDKKILEYDLDRCPVYGYYSELTLQEITNRIDWTLKKGYIEIDYCGRLPVIIYSDAGWEIERETYAEELLQNMVSLLEGKDYSFVLELKGRNRGMILLLIEKIKALNNARFIPLLKAWKEIEFKKVQHELEKAIDHLAKSGTIF